MRIIGKLGDDGCSDGTCPALWTTDDPELVAVQGATLIDPQALADVGEVPGHESLVIVPRSLLAGYREAG